MFVMLSGARQTVGGELPLSIHLTMLFQCSYREPPTHLQASTVIKVLRIDRVANH
jgi:hypothetical protein